MSDIEILVAMIERLDNTGDYADMGEIRDSIIEALDTAISDYNSEEK